MCCRYVDVEPDNLQEVVDYVQSEATAAATAVRDDIVARFPPTEVLDALMIIYPEYWNRSDLSDFDDYTKKLQVRWADRFCFS